MEPLITNPSLKTEPVVEEYNPTLLHRLGVLFFGILAFSFFLLMKMPEARIQNLVIAHLRILAQDQGMLFSAEKVRIGMLLGPSIKIYNAELKAIDDEQQTLKIPFLKIRPHLFSLLTKTKTAGISIEVLNGNLSGDVGMSATSLAMDLSLDSLDLSSATLLKKFIPLAVGATLDGKIKVDFDQELPQKSDGLIQLKISKLQLPPQNFMGFNLPKINIAQSKIDITIGQGQFVAREFQVGQDLKTDDLVAKITGEGSLDRLLERSRLNAKAVFQVSNGVFQSFPLLDALLSPAKTSDGKYSYRISGTFSGLEARPGG